MMATIVKRIFSSRLVQLLLALLVMLFAAALFIPSLVDSKSYTDNVITEVRTVSGAALLVKGGSEFRILPRPALLLKKVELTQPGAVDAPVLSADIVEINISLASLLTDTWQAEAVRVAGASTTLGRAGNSEVKWGFLGTPLLKMLAATQPDHPLALEMIGGNITITGDTTQPAVVISNISAAGQWADTLQLAGILHYQDAPLQFSASRKGVLGATPVSFSLNSDELGRVDMNGTMDFTADAPVITGKLEMVLANLFGLLAPDSVTETSQKVPVQLSADYVQNDTQLSLSNMSLDMMNSKASGTLNLLFGAEQSDQLALNFGTLDIKDIRSLFDFYKNHLMRPENERLPTNLFDPSIDMVVNITSDQVLNGAQIWENALFSGAVVDGLLSINQLRLQLPGESTVSLFGLLSASDTQGVRFQGDTEAEGKSLRELLTVFDASAANLPSLGFGEYKLRANLFVSSELLRLSEADARLSDLNLKGGLVAYFDRQPRIEADIALQDIDFDYFRNHWREHSDNMNDRHFLRFDRNMSFDWLRKLAASINFNIGVEEFTLFERKGKKASLSMFAQAGELSIYNAKFNFGEDITEANFKLDVTKTTPNLNLVLNTKQLNTNYFALNPKPDMEVQDSPTIIEKDLPDMVMPELTPEEELRRKIAEEAEQLGLEVVSPPIQEVPEADPVMLNPPIPDVMILESGQPPPPPPLPVMPETQTIITTEPQSLLISEANAQDVPVTVSSSPVWSEELLDMSFMEGINGTFDISIGALQHEDKLVQNFKMQATLERNLMTFKTLTFIYWGGSFSVNGTLFGGKVPGISLGFVVASVDLREMLDDLLNITSIGGRGSISGSIDTSGVNMMSWVSQATSKLLVAGRGVTIRGLDMASVLNAVSVSRTAADVYNNVNISVISGAGEYSADGAINIQKGVITTPGIALKTGKVLGTVTGDFRLIPWDIKLTGLFRFPELSAQNVPTMTVQWSGAVDNPVIQTDTQSLEAFVSKRITGN